jgi:hypothetical protein
MTVLRTFPTEFSRRLMADGPADRMGRPPMSLNTLAGISSPPPVPPPQEAPTASFMPVPHRLLVGAYAPQAVDARGGISESEFCEQLAQIAAAYEGTAFGRAICEQLPRAALPAIDAVVTEVEDTCPGMDGWTDPVGYVPSERPYSDEPCQDDQTPISSMPDSAAESEPQGESVPSGDPELQPAPDNVVAMPPGHRRVPASEVLTPDGVPLDRADYGRSLSLRKQRPRYFGRDDPMPSFTPPSRG